MLLVIRQSNDAVKSQRVSEESQAALKRNLERLGDATARIRTATAETVRLQALNAELQRRLLEQGLAIKNLAQEAIRSTTGGNSYPVLAFTGISDEGAWPVLWSEGKYPLRHVQVSIVDDAELMEKLKRGPTINDIVNSGVDFEFASLAPGAAAAFKQPIKFTSNHDAYNFVVRLFADNGAWDEVIKVRRIDGKWVSAFRVTRKRADGSDVFVHEQSDPTFPRVNGKIAWTND